MVRNHHTPPSPDPAGSGTESKVTHPFSPSPEPWTVLEDSMGIQICKPGVSGHLVRLAEFPLFGHSVLTGVLPDAEARSNARLFMAAPRMLRALRNVLGELRKYELHDIVKCPHQADAYLVERVSEANNLLYEITGELNPEADAVEGGAL